MVKVLVQKRHFLGMDDCRSICVWLSIDSAVADIEVVVGLMYKHWYWYQHENIMKVRGPGEPRKFAKMVRAVLTYYGLKPRDNAVLSPAKYVTLSSTIASLIIYNGNRQHVGHYYFTAEQFYEAEYVCE